MSVSQRKNIDCVQDDQSTLLNTGGETQGLGIAEWSTFQTQLSCGKLQINTTLSKFSLGRESAGRRDTISPINRSWGKGLAAFEPTCHFLLSGIVDNSLRLEKQTDG